MKEPGRNPAILARNAATLVSKHGYALEKAGLIDMFSHPAQITQLY